MHFKKYRPEKSLQVVQLTEENMQEVANAIREHSGGELWVSYTDGSSGSPHVTTRYGEGFPGAYMTIDGMVIPNIDDWKEAAR